MTLYTLWNDEKRAKKELPPVKESSSFLANRECAYQYYITKNWKIQVIFYFS